LPIKLRYCVEREDYSFVLQVYAKTLKSATRRLLDAANMEARAKELAQKQ
jgi:hypothetical protein